MKKEHFQQEDQTVLNFDVPNNISFKVLKNLMKFYKEKRATLQSQSEIFNINFAVMDRTSKFSTPNQ
jgi:hypothetical protein